jgi:hypothetical protein
MTDIVERLDDLIKLAESHYHYYHVAQLAKDAKTEIEELRTLRKVDAELILALALEAQ